MLPQCDNVYVLLGWDTIPTPTKFLWYVSFTSVITNVSISAPLDVYVYLLPLVNLLTLYLSYNLEQPLPSYLHHARISAYLLCPSYSCISTTSPPTTAVSILLLYLPPYRPHHPIIFPAITCIFSYGVRHHPPPPKITISIVLHLFCLFPCRLCRHTSPSLQFLSSHLFTYTLPVVSHIFRNSSLPLSLILTFSSTPIMICLHLCVGYLYGNGEG